MPGRSKIQVQSGAMELPSLAKNLGDALTASQHRLVLAESCTGGLIAASLATVPGISSVFCGSSVVYREQTKSAWLGIPPDLLRVASAVSAEVTTLIAMRVLEQTPEATIGLGITGHLGPAAPADLDGRYFLSCWTRGKSDLAELATRSGILPNAGRVLRQQEAARQAMVLLHECVQL